MNKIITTVIIICFIINIAGCIEEKTTISTELPAITASQNSGQEQETESPTQNATVISAPETIWKTDVTLESGYEWYQNDEFGYKIAYPKDWGTHATDQYFSTFPLEYTSIFGTDEPLALYVHIRVEVNSNQTQSRFWETGFILDEKIPIGLEELKKQERIIEYKNISVNDKDGIELVFSPLMLYWPEATLSGIPTTVRYILFTNDDLDYIIQISSSDVFFSKYKDTFEYIMNSFIIK